MFRFETKTLLTQTNSAIKQNYKINTTQYILLHNIMSGKTLSVL